MSLRDPDRPSPHRSEWARLAAFGAAIAALHVVGWGLFLHHARTLPALVGLGTLAYTLGLRHAFDADHLAAIDGATRALLQQSDLDDRPKRPGGGRLRRPTGEGRRPEQPIGVGFFFSLGHSTVVLCLSVALSVATVRVQASIPWLRRFGELVGPGLSGLLLWAIGLANAFVLADAWRSFRGRGMAEAGGPEHSSGGPFSWLLSGRLWPPKEEDGSAGRRAKAGGPKYFIDASWKLFPVGALFGLGFDTATEVGLLALSAGVASRRLPPGAILSLPLLFAAGMCLIDTADGAFMTRAFRWAMSGAAASAECFGPSASARRSAKPPSSAEARRRKGLYNLVVTGLSTGLALGIGTIEILQLISARLGWTATLWRGLRALDLGTLGGAIAATFALAWLGAVALWKAAPPDARR